MVKKFGTKKHKKNQSRAGTGFVSENAGGNIEKWASATASQLADNVKKILVKNLPISYIKTDQDNPRKLAIDINLVKNIQKTFSINQFLKNEEDNDWVEDYVKKVAKEFDLKYKQINDFRSIVLFTAVLKSADRLLHPIVVWQEDSTFHLISGERRLLTHILLGENYIASKITDTRLSDNEISILQWEENIHREDMTLFEKAMRLEKLIIGTFGFDKISVRKLAKVSGLSVADAQRYLVIIKYKTKYQSTLLIDAIESGLISGLQQCASLAQLSKEELEAKLFGKSPIKETKVKPSIKINKNVDSKIFEKIINVVVKEFKADEILDNLDLSQSKDINIAFNALVEFLKNK